MSAKRASRNNRLPSTTRIVYRRTGARGLSQVIEAAIGGPCQSLTTLHSVTPGSTKSRNMYSFLIRYSVRQFEAMFRNNQNDITYDLCIARCNTYVGGLNCRYKSHHSEFVRYCNTVDVLICLFTEEKWERLCVLTWGFDNTQNWADRLSWDEYVLLWEILWHVLSCFWCR